jgi:hypothetical protein
MPKTATNTRLDFGCRKERLRLTKSKVRFLRLPGSELSLMDLMALEPGNTRYFGFGQFGLNRGSSFQVFRLVPGGLTNWTLETKHHVVLHSTTPHVRCNYLILRTLMILTYLTPSIH